MRCSPLEGSFMQPLACCRAMSASCASLAGSLTCPLSAPASQRLSSEAVSTCAKVACCPTNAMLARWGGSTLLQEEMGAGCNAGVGEGQLAQASHRGCGSSSPGLLQWRMRLWTCHSTLPPTCVPCLWLSLEIQAMRAAAQHVLQHWLTGTATAAHSCRRRGRGSLQSRRAPAQERKKERALGVD